MKQGNQRSRLGYSSGSPFAAEPSNQIDAKGITMQNTRRPLIAANRKGAQQLQPGKEYPNIKGNTTEMPIEMLLELEPMLLEKHLTTLSDKDKEVFTEKYGVLGTDMKTAALMQMLAKYPEIAQAVQQQSQVGSFQSGGGVKSIFDPKYASSDTGFQKWFKDNTPEGRSGVGFGEVMDYDYYSFYKNGEAARYKGGHFPDTYKTPAHSTFSDESLYATPENAGGHWRGESYQKNRGRFGNAYQSGGIVQVSNTLPSGNPSLLGNFGGNPLQNFYGAPQESTMTSPFPVTAPDTSQMFDPEVTQDLIDEKTNEILSDTSPYVSGAMTENYSQKQRSGQMRPSLLRNNREKKNGGSTLSKTKAAEMLHDGTVHGTPITDKQRRYFAAIAFSDKKKSKMQSGGTTGGWKYEAPPTEGFHLVGIESNRPQNNIKELPPQGIAPSGKDRTASSGSLRKMTDAEVEAWYKAHGAVYKRGQTPALDSQQQINNARMSSEPAPYNWDAPPASNTDAISQLEHPSWLTDNLSPYEPSSFHTDNTIRQLRNPQWMLQSQPAQPPVSNTSRAIAAVTADPVWNEIMYRTPMQRPRQEVYPPVRLRTEDAMGTRPKTAQASKPDEYQKWKSVNKFTDFNPSETSRMQEVKSLKNGDTMLTLTEVGQESGQPISIYFIRDGRTGKYAFVPWEEVDYIKALK